MSKLSINDIKQKLDPSVVAAIEKYFPADSVDEAIAVAYHESGGNTSATNSKGNSNGIDHGIFQINDYYHPEVKNIDPYDPEANIALAAEIWRNRGWKEWSNTTIDKAKLSVPTIKTDKPIMSNKLSTSKRDEVVKRLTEMGVSTTDGNGKPLSDDKLLANYATGLGGNKNIALKSAKDYPSELDYILDVTNDKFKTDTLGIQSNPFDIKSDVKSAYERNYGFTPDLGMIPSFTPKDLSGIPTGETTQTTSTQTTTPQAQIPDNLNISNPELVIDDTLDITDAPIKDPNNPGVGDYASLLRFAPAIGSMVNMLDKDKPYDLTLNRLGASRKLTPEQINESMLSSELASAYNTGVNNIVSTSGGNASTARANIQGLNIGNAKAKADAFSKINMFNIQNKLGADQFNIQNENAISQGNVGIANQEEMINMQNKLAAEAKKEADRAAFYNSMGQVGVEQFYGNVVSSANNGYSTDIYGRKKYNPK